MHPVEEKRYVGYGEALAYGFAAGGKAFVTTPTQSGYLSLFFTKVFGLPAGAVSFMMLLSGTMGKVYLLCLALCGAMFNILGARLRENNLYRQMAVDEELLLQLSALEEEGSIRKPTKKRKKSRGGRIFRNVVMGLMLAVFAVSGATVLFVRHQYKVSETLYEEAASTFTAESKPLSIELPAYQAQEKFRLPEIAPIEVDFAALQKINPDVTAWITV